MNQIPDDRIAYVAGLFDAEGCVTIARDCYKGRTPYHRLQASVANTDFAMLDDLKRDFGGFICKVKRYKKHHRPGWQWYVTNGTAAEFLRALHPHLIVKAEQADLALEFMREKTPLPSSGADPNDMEIVRREQHYQRMKVLNLKGVETNDAKFAKPTRGKFIHHDQKAAYLAGMIDGDGSIFIGRTTMRRKDGKAFPAYSLSVVIIGTCRHLADWLCSNFEGRSNTYPLREGHKTRVEWKAYGDHAAKVLQLIGPYLRLKKDQQESALKFQLGRNKLTKGSSLAEVIAEISWREGIYQDIRMLNQRGNTAATTKSTAPVVLPGEAIV